MSEGHSSAEGSTARVLKFDKNGKFLKSWGKLGKGPGEFDQPHALAMDSKGRLFVGDRSNNRIQIFDQDGNLPRRVDAVQPPERHRHRPRATHIYVADSESGSVNPAHGAWTRGIRIGSARDGTVTCAHSRPLEDLREGSARRRSAVRHNTSAAEGVAVDRAGNIYGAEVGPRALKKYIKKVRSYRYRFGFRMPAIRTRRSLRRRRTGRRARN